jgi:hypothetical protein
MLQFEDLVIPQLSSMLDETFEVVRKELNISREDFIELLRTKGDGIFEKFDDTLTDFILDRIDANYLDEQHHIYVKQRQEFLKEHQEMFHYYFVFIHSSYNVLFRIRSMVDKQKLDVGDYTMIGLLGTLCRMADDIGQALAGGSVRSALAQWRNFYEHAVVGIFLMEKDSADLFKRFADFSHRDVKKQSESFEVHHKSLKFPPLPGDQTNKIIERTADLKSTYGSDFLDDYAWAKEALGEKRADFRKIETQANMSRYRPFYIWASNYCHPNFNAIISISSQPDKENLIDPMQLTIFTFKIFLDHFLFRYSVNNQYGSNILPFWKIVDRLRKAFDA